MNLMESMQGVKGYSDSREEEEEEEAAVVATAATGEESSSARLHSPQSQQQQDAAWNSNPMINHRKQQQQLELMELTLGSSSRKQEEELGGNLQQASSSTSGKDDEAAAAAAAVLVVEKEHMFDKVVTPSDVGKLNRLVIPKQHAEKYFPLDSSSNEKGLLLNFEDRNGKLWRFRYSYWNSSQSYVMTKGWSRFVKEKKLDAGDIVSFHRGIGELYRHRLYIDWRPRSHHIPHPSNSLFHTLPYFLPNHHYSTATATARLYSLHSSTTNNYSNSTTIMPPPPPPYRDHHFHHHLNYDNNNNFYTLHQHHQYPAEQLNSSLYYLTSPTPTTSPSMPVSAGDQHFPGPGQQLQERRNINNVPMIIDSVPVAHHHRAGTGTGTLITGATTPASNNNNNNNNTTGKRLRLFGVNMECASSSASTAHVAMPNSHSLASSSLQRLSLPREDPLSSSSTPRFGDQKGGTSVLFDLDPSTQYQK